MDKSVVENLYQEIKECEDEVKSKLEFTDFRDTEIEWLKFKENQIERKMKLFGMINNQKKKD